MRAYDKNQNILIIGGFILISTICVSPMLFFGKTLVLRDTFFEFRFLYGYARENILNGIIPLWNPYSNCGQPFIANPQSAVFYPLNWLYYLLNFQGAYTLFIFIHLLLAGVFMYAFIKPIVKNSWISFFGGLIYMLNGLLISRVEFLSEFASLAWIPAILALLRINVVSPSLLSSVLLGLAIALQFFAGHTQSFYFTALLGLVFLAFLVGIYYIREKDGSAVLRSMKFLIIAGVLALLIVMIQLAPTYELFTQSLRSQPGYDRFRWPSSSLLFGTISMSVTAPLGLKWLLQSTTDRVTKNSRWPLVIFGALISVCLVFAVVINVSPSLSGKIAEAVRPTPSQPLEDLRGLVVSDEVNFVIHQPASYTNPNQVQAVIEADRDGILVLSDVFYPGWELFVNGEKQKIYKANTTFRAGVLKAGVNKILFNYNPQSFKIGLIFTLLGIGLTIFLLIIHFRTREAPQRQSA